MSMASPGSEVARPWSAARDYLQGVWNCRFFWGSLVKMDLRTRYRRSVLGVAWSLLQPIAMTIVLCTVFHKLFDMNAREYGPFLLSGLTFWSFLNFIVHQGCQCFYLGETYIRQHPAPLAIYPLRTVLGGSIHFLLALVVVIGLAWICQGHVDPWIPFKIAPGLLMLFALGWAMAILAGFANVFFSDIQHLLELGLQILFYATPIIYKPSMLRERGLGWLAEYNPLVPLLETIRSPILEGTMPGLGAYAVAGALSLLASLFATWSLARWQHRLIFHL